MIAEEIVSNLLDKAEAEEKVYNWLEAANLYNSIIKLYLDNELIKKAADTYKRLGYVYSRAAETMEKADEYLEQYKNCVNAYKDAAINYKQNGNKAEELECMAEISYLNGYINESLAVARDFYSKSYDLFVQSSAIYSREKDQEGLAWTLSRTAMTLSLRAYFSIDYNEIKQFIDKSENLSLEAWELSKEVKDPQSIAESLLSTGLLAPIDGFIEDYKWNENFRQRIRNQILMCNESLKLSESFFDDKFLGIIYSMTGLWNCLFGVQVVEDEGEQREYIDKGLEFLEMGLEFAKKANDKQVMLLSIFWLDWWALFGGRIEYLQKRLFKDLNEYIKMGKRCGNLVNIWRWYANIYPAMYYTNAAQRSFFTPDQKKTYAEQGIKFAKEAMKISAYSPLIVLSYQMLTWSYSLLITLALSEDDWDKYAQQMLQYAKESQIIAEKGFGGLATAGAYSSLSKAYKTLADIAENKEKRIEMLSAAAEASKKYIGHAMESRTGIIIAKMRLGLLYEELDIISQDIKFLKQAKEIFLELIKDSFERGYISYAASAHEYLARVEDRLGNHIASAENYEKALELHKKSLINVGYKRLKNRVNEKIGYTQAWNLIERAKTSNKREDHLKAKEYYEKAREILKNLRNYKYETSYFTAWALLEEAEQLSKQNNQKEAIKQYKETKMVFKEAIESLEQASKQSKEKSDKERIEKLEKAAKVRIDYCSARINLEKAKILGKQGEHNTAAEKFAMAASQFRNICTIFKIKRERKELEAIYYLCRAWESMELAENYKDAERFAEAANLFEKASIHFTANKLKLLASGNSAFCQALEQGCKFDASTETQVKAQIYPQVKSMLRKAASTYGKGGFEKEADWALATSTYFDAAWHLIKADEEMRLDEKKKLLDLGSGILKSSSELFSKAGYYNKEKEVKAHLDMVKKEEKILFSALNSIKEPSISRSTMGIVSPACPIETSQSPRIGEIRQLFEEERRVALEGELKKKYQIIYSDLLKKYPSVQRREFRVGIAQIGLSNTGDILNEFYEVKSSGLLGLRDDKVDLVKANVKKMIEIANKNRINILLFPEMTVDLNYSECLEEISDLAKLYEMYIIPGSYHDQETKRNVSMIIGPDGILLEQEKHIPAIIHMDGKRFKEGIDVGISPRKIIVCNTEFGRIAIAICRDFLDMDLRVELKNFEPPVDIILNPAFTPVTADFKAAHFDARRSIYAYCFFANVAEFGDSLIYTPEKERIERTIPAKEEGLIYKDVDIFKLRSERKKWEKEQEKDVKFIQSTRT